MKQFTYIVIRWRFFNMLFKRRPRCLYGKQKVRFGVSSRWTHYKGDWRITKIVLGCYWQACGSKGKMEGICEYCWFEEER
jgi:hypothetical protein